MQQHGNGLLFHRLHALLDFHAEIYRDPVQAIGVGLVVDHRHGRPGVQRLRDSAVRPDHLQVQAESSIPGCVERHDWHYIDTGNGLLRFSRLLGERQSDRHSAERRPEDAVTLQRALPL